MHSVPTSFSLPRSVDAVKLCQQDGRLAGHVPLVRMERLCQQLHTPEGQAQVDWAFMLDEQSRRVIHGHVQAVLPLVCQRCLERVDIPVHSDTVLALVWNDEQAAQLPRSLDPVLMGSEMLDVLETVEDELLLALPIVAAHEAGECQTAMPQVMQVQPDEAAEKKTNPFQVLANLKTERDETDS